MGFVTDATMGVDLGSRIDRTAVTVCECSTRETGRVIFEWHQEPLSGAWEHPEAAETETIWTVRHLERMPLFVSYPTIVKRITEMVDKLIVMLADREHARLAADPEVHFIPSRREIVAEATSHVFLNVDATGLGQPVVDLLRDSLRESGVYVNPIYFTYGDKLTTGGSGVRMGKQYLVSRLAALIQCLRVVLPKTQEARALQEELEEYQVKVSRDGVDTYGASTGAHDDLVVSLALATMTDPIQRRVQLAPSLYD